MFTLYMNLCVLSIGSSLVCFYLFLAALPVQYEGSPEPISSSVFNAVKVRIYNCKDRGYMPQQN